jgi:hypothetical protein
MTNQEKIQFCRFWDNGMVKLLLIAAILVDSPFTSSGPLTYDFEVVMSGSGLDY